MNFEPVTSLQTLLSNNFSDFFSNILSVGVILFTVILIAFIFWLIVSKSIYKILEKISKNTKSTWDDILIKHKFFSRLSWLIPAIIIRIFSNEFLSNTEKLKIFILKSCDLLIILSISLALIDFLTFVNSIYSLQPSSKKRPIKGIIQACQVVILVASLLIAFSVITNKSVNGLLAGLGALSAVMMLIFQEPLKGLVAGFQISSNDMVRIGDWISAPAHNADGDVIDINLLTVTVQNWDKTIVSVPIKSLTTDSFKNWRGMSESGGRRIKRSILIDISSIHFLNDEEIQSLRNIAFLNEYISKKEKEIFNFNRNSKYKRDLSPVNGRALTNIGVFRVYAQNYLIANPKINKNLTLMVRQLQSNAQGLPLEIYAFSSDKIWVNYEKIQADIFDHLLAVLPEFNLRVFQQPTGRDLKQLSIQN